MIKLLYEDKNILAFEKPVGMVVNDSETQKGRYLVLEQLLIVKKDEYDIEEGLERSGIIHRLDKDTSGVLLIAKTPSALKMMQKLFKERHVEKEYVCVVSGQVKDSEFEIDAPIGRDARNRFKFCVKEGGKPALTTFKKVKEFLLNGSTYTVLKCYPQTGRTHQIRVHLGAYGKFVAGDVIYESRMQLEKDQANFGRLMLHAHKISFTYPGHKKKITITSEVPTSFML